MKDGREFYAIGQEGSFARFQSMGELGNIIDINIEPMQYGAGGAGTVYEKHREIIEANLEPIQVRILEGDQE